MGNSDDPDKAKDSLATNESGESCENESSRDNPNFDYANNADETQHVTSNLIVPQNIREPSQLQPNVPANADNSSNGVNNTDSEKKTSGAENVHKRIDSLLQRLRSGLGNESDSYQDALLDFISGKLNKSELEEAFTRFSQAFPAFVILSVLTNAYSEDLPGQTSALHGWSRKRKETSKKKTDSRSRRLKAEVLALSYRERKRIKSMVRDPKKRPLPKPGVLIETRISRLPKVPVTKDRLNSVFANEIMKGQMIPLLSESRLLPDLGVLRDRMSSIATEQGLLGGLNEHVTEVLLTGLENHLKNNIMAIVERVKRNRAENINYDPPRHDLIEDEKDIERRDKQCEARLTLAELESCWAIQPGVLIEPQPSTLRQLELYPPDHQMDEEYEKQHFERLERIQNMKDDVYWNERMQLAIVLDEILDT